MKPYKEVFQFPQGPITSIVMDEDEFTSLVEELTGIFNIASKERVDDNAKKALLEAKHIPMIGKGTKTQFVFDRYEIETNMACFAVRGFAQELVMDMISRNYVVIQAP